MQVTINIDNPEPAFAQLTAQIKQGVLGGSLNPGDALPSIRQLAQDLSLNPKTVAKAYRMLERDQVIESKGYRGTFIHQNAMAGSTHDLAAWVHERLTKTIAVLRDAGATDSEIRIAFGNAMNQQISKGT
ncbi:MAG: GntR family transcriptional regulator [Robiginitomaculum sp.]|nr:GntR family transcriptional regulator [Robiginitomaculum sp.]